MVCSNESPLQNPVIREAGESSFHTGKKSAVEKPCRWGGEEQAACSPSHLQKEEMN